VRGTRAKRDANERGILDLWSALGCYAETVSGPGNMDTLLHFDGDMWRVEVKAEGEGLTKKQVEHFTAAHNAGVPTYIVRTVADAANLLEGTLEPWKPEDGALAGASRKERPFRPGHSKARSVREMCAEPGCAKSRAPSIVLCEEHSAKAVRAIQSMSEHAGCPDVPCREETHRCRRPLKGGDFAPCDCASCRPRRLKAVPTPAVHHHKKEE
jgi:hypothetical protein